MKRKFNLTNLIIIKMKKPSLKSKLKARKDNGSANIEGAVITASQFLGLEKGKPGYSNHGEYSKYLDSLREAECDELEEFYECIASGLKMLNSTVQRVDRNGRPYIYSNFLKPNAQSGYKVITEAGMLQFIKDYQDGKVKISFSIDELAELAFNS